GTAHAFHDLGRGRAKRQRGGQDHAHRFLRAVGKGEAVAHALAVKVHIGFGGEGNAGKGFGGHGRTRSVEVGKALILGQPASPLLHAWTSKCKAPRETGSRGAKMWLATGHGRYQRRQPPPW